MWMPEPPEPKLWKAWIFTALCAAPVTWSIIALGHGPVWVFLPLGFVLSFVAAKVVNDRMIQDWRATDTLQARHFDYHTGATHKYTIKK